LSACNGCHPVKAWPEMRYSRRRAITL